MATLSELEQEWDAIVIGTGMGGAVLGHALARAGQRVLFCEKGRSSDEQAQALRGAYPETAFPEPLAPAPEHRAVLQRAGRYPEQIADRSGARGSSFIPFIGSGNGGSTALYGMALERFFPADFAPRQAFPQAPADCTLPDAWPVSYQAMTPYYEQAEILFRLRGSADTLRPTEGRAHLMPAPPLTPASAELFEFFQRQQLHPYRLPLACEFVEGCSGCQGYLCARECKNDANRICLRPALRQHGALLLDECEVLRLEADRSAVSGVVCNWRGREIRLRGRQVILAAGALESPRLLLRSASAHWPAGLANDSGLVGKNLMRHHIDLYLIRPKLRPPFDNRQKEFAFNDFYQVDGQKLGSVQSFGRLPPAPVLAASLADDLRQGPAPWLAPLFALVRPLVQRFLGKLVDQHLILASTLEDLPYADNCVTLSPDDGARLQLRYRTRPHDQQRIAAFRQLIKQSLRPYPYQVLKQADNNQRIAHACGTCRFGHDPRSSVLDANNRAHGLANLYVVDSSFFPSSGGTNPSLTIAANALRVADHLLGRQRT
ncbi:GMC oxidoreductase [Duganella callida]|uniref:GMC family oxidoreductase n=1 Tax=Duganella callida TaxID=2561932 RepID=A0A4Y9SB84_9BURK|nr:GMC family oxidoreductase [Duganella callida]TFW19280.1 GMC family oxidoreductase [Duganella callida]